MKKVFTMLFLILILGTFVSCKTERAQDLSLFDTVFTADEALDASKDGSVVVFEDMKCTSGKELWDAFYQTVSQGKSASVLCAHYYTLDEDRVSQELYEAEKDLYPMLFFYLLEYDGDLFTVTVRQSTENEIEHKDSFPYLMHYTGEAPAQASFSSYDYYVLVNDQTLTWNDIVVGLISSQLNTDADLGHCRIYQDTVD